MNDREVELRELVAALAALDTPAIEEQTVELGLIGIGIDESDGGSGGSLSDLLVVIEEFAAQGMSSPLVDASCAHWVLDRCGHGADFATRSTVKVLEHLSWDDRTPQVLPEVPWARQSARVVIVDGAGTVYNLDVAMARIEPASNVAGEPRDSLVIDGHSATRIGHVDVESVLCRLALLRSAAMLGAATGVYRVTKDHVRQRHQFGAPLLRIPAVATQLATLKTHVLQMQTALTRAVAVYEQDGAEAALTAAAIARVMCASCAGDVARIGHQLHGAIGTTSEHQLHHYTRPLWAWRDDDALPRQWQQLVGRAALSGGESSTWHQLTSPM